MEKKVIWLKRYSIKVYGKVQDVGFRYFAAYTAKLFNLTGWVKNCDNGSVEMEVQGIEKAITLFVEKFKKGNGFCRIENIDCKKIDTLPKEESFRIVY
jgi:acylphosphatase